MKWDEGTGTGITKPDSFNPIIIERLWIYQFKGVLCLIEKYCVK